jgi:hypothetical protein
MGTRGHPLKAFLIALTIALLASVSVPAIADSKSTRCAELLTALEQSLMSQKRQNIENAVLNAVAAELLRAAPPPSAAETTNERALLGISVYCDRNRQDTIAVAAQAWIATLPRAANIEVDPKASLAVAIPSPTADSSDDLNHEGLFNAIAVAVLTGIWGFWVFSDKLPPRRYAPSKSETDSVGHGSLPPSFQVAAAPSSRPSAVWTMEVRLALLIAFIVPICFFSLTTDFQRRVFVMHFAVIGAPIILGLMIGGVAGFVTWKVSVIKTTTFVVSLILYGLSLAVWAVTGHFPFRDFETWRAVDWFLFMVFVGAWVSFAICMWKIVIAGLVIWRRRHPSDPPALH